MTVSRVFKDGYDGYEDAEKPSVIYLTMLKVEHMMS